MQRLAGNILRRVVHRDEYVVEGLGRTVLIDDDGTNLIVDRSGPEGARGRWRTVDPDDPAVKRLGELDVVGRGVMHHVVALETAIRVVPLTVHAYGDTRSVAAGDVARRAARVLGAVDGHQIEARDEQWSR